jgi:gamma-glutamyltranspeptidase / glutathione hydrolase
MPDERRTRGHRTSGGPVKWYCRVVVFYLIACVVVLVDSTSAAGPGSQASRAPIPPANQVASQAMVAAAGPYAASAGAQVLSQGGNVVDAAVAVAAALNVTESYASGIGGGGFLLVHQASPPATYALDCRETAPTAVTTSSFANAQGTPLPMSQLSTGGIAVGVPGSVACWSTALQLWGQMSLGTVLQPAINYATQGFTIYPYYNSEIVGQQSRLRLFPDSARIWLPNGTPLPVGATLVQPDLARTLQNIATVGPSYVYATLAPTIAAAVRNPPWTPTPGVTVLPGLMTAQDLNNYQVLQHAPLQTEYHGYTVVSHSAPSSAPNMLEALNILQPYRFQNCVTPVTTPSLSCLGPDNPTSIHLINEAFRLASADRLAWLADPSRQFQPTLVPCRGLINSTYAATRQALITPTAAAPLLFQGNPYPFNPPNVGGCEPTPVSTPEPAPQRVRGGNPPAALASALAGDDGEVAAAGQRRSSSSTTHLVVADGAGNAVSYTTTLAEHFGSGMVVPGTGILLNNTLTDFDPNPGNANHSPNNVVNRGKRPWGTEAPTMVFDAQGQLLWVYGVAGGPWITPSVVELTIDFLDWQMDPQTAINRWRFLPEPISLAGPDIAIEATVVPTAPVVPGQATPTAALTPAVSQTMVVALQQMGHVPLVLATPGSAGQAIARAPGSGALVGAADPRRQGATAVVSFPPTATATPTIHPLTQTAIALTGTPTPTIHPLTQTAVVQTATVQALTATATPTIHPLTQTAIAQTATVQALTATATPTIHPLTQTAIALTPTATTTPVQAPTTPPNGPPASGTPGVAAATSVGQVIQYTSSGPNGVSGVWRKTGSGVFAFSATNSTAGIVPGSLPALTLPTTAGNESGAPLAGARTVCTPVGTAVPFTTICQGATVGDVLLGAQVRVTFATVGGGTAVSTGVPVAGAPASSPTPTPVTAIVVAGNPPLPPPPPPIFLPPLSLPLPPPPVPLAPLPLAAPRPGTAGPPLEVPVVPEAEPSLLLGLGLGALGVLARARRRREQ